jgi:hypothetical protein
MYGCHIRPRGEGAAMPDPVSTSIVTLAAAHVLGESFTASADYLGVELKQCTEAAMQRFRRISSSAQRKLGRRLEEDGAVNPRVFKKVVDDGYFCSDGLSADYYGGFLASSHSKDGKDDTNVPFVSMINRMSSDQLHGHWILYAILFNRMYGRWGFHLYTYEGRKKAALYIPWSCFMFLFNTLRVDDIGDSLSKFEFAGSDRHHYVTVNEEFVRKLGEFDYRRLDLVFWGLLTSSLVDHIYWGLTGWDLADRMQKDYPSDPLGIAQKKLSEEDVSKLRAGEKWSDSTGVDNGGIVFEPSILGMDLFLRAQGLPPNELISFESLKYEFYPEQFQKELMEDVRLVDRSPPNA